MLTTWALTVCLVGIISCGSALGPSIRDSCDATGPCPPKPPSPNVLVARDHRRPSTEDSQHAVGAHVDGEGSEGGLTRLWRSTSSVLRSTLSVAKNTVYNNLVEPTVDRIRTVVREEIFGLIEWLETQVFSPDQPLGKFVRVVGTTSQTVILVLLCVLFSYIFLRYLSLLSALAFNCFVFLLHHFYGPEWVLLQIWLCCKWIYWVMMLMVAHPYISAFLVVVLFIGNTLVQVYRWEEARSQKRKVDKIDSNVVEVKNAIMEMERRLNRRLRQIEWHLGMEEHSETESD